jgi:uncharacterized membrane protein
LSRPDSAPPGDSPASGSERVDVLNSNLLRTGVLASMALIFVGLALMFLHHPSYLRSADALQRLTTPGAAFPQTIPDVVAGLRERHGQSVVVIGLLVLIVTPILRVALSIVLFALERDRAFVVITIAVLTILLASFSLGTVG